MDANWTLTASLALIGFVILLAVLFSYSQKPPPDTTDELHFDGFTMDDDAHTTVHGSDVGFERD